MLPLTVTAALAAARQSDLRQQALRAEQAGLARRKARRGIPQPPTSRWRHWPKLRNRVAVQS